MEAQIEDSDGLPSVGRSIDGTLTPGHNVDVVNIAAGMAMLESIGYEPNTEIWMLVQYALQRWGRGEEGAAENMALGLGQWKGDDFPSVDLTSWRMVLAAAVSGDES